MTAHSEQLCASNLPMDCGAQMVESSKHNLVSEAVTEIPASSSSASPSSSAWDSQSYGDSDMVIEGDGDSESGEEDDCEKQDDHVHIPESIPSSIRRFLCKPADYLAQNSEVARLVVGTVAFTNATAVELAEGTGETMERRVLLVQRHHEDYMGTKWEVPGGSCDMEDGVTEDGRRTVADASIISAACRELKEEAGLSAARLIEAHGRGRQEGDVASEESDTEVDNMTAGGAVDEYHEWIDKEMLWRKITFIVEVDNNNNNNNNHHHHHVGSHVTERLPRVTLDPKEHDDFVWATEREAAAGTCDGREIMWTSRRQRQTVLRSFEVMRARDGDN